VSAFDPGSLTVTWRPADAPGGIADCAVRCERPDVAGRLRGLEAQQAVALIPLLYALCSRAQGCAARLAWAAAQGQEVAAHVDAAVAAEAAREHAWRLCLDWPAQLGLAVDRPAFAGLAAAIAAGQRPGWTPPAWIETLADEAPRAAALPALDARASLQEWPPMDASFARRPLWRGAFAETGALARSGALEGGVRARVQARASELRDYLRGRPVLPGRASAVPVVPGMGRALVETARGTLLHEIGVRDGRVESYVIVAPTDWNFHAEGPLALQLRAALQRDAAGDGARVQEALSRWVLALDPCVRWAVERSSEGDGRRPGE
jgi:hypothetical protein